MKYLRLIRGIKVNVGTILAYNPKQFPGNSIYETAAWFVKLRGSDLGAWVKYDEIEPE